MSVSLITPSGTIYESTLLVITCNATSSDSVGMYGKFIELSYCT